MLTPGSVLLTDRVAVVTGAAAGIGRATAILMARFGATLVVCDRDADGLASAADEVRAARPDGPPPIVRVLDVRDADAIDEMLTAAVDAHGRIDVLVNNAGGTFFAPFVDVSPGGEAAVVAANFTQVTRLIRGCVARMPEAGGAIVNVTSIEAHQAAPGFAVYGAMKAALAQLTRSLALELAPRGIRVNAMAPDAIPTAGDDGIQDTMAEQGTTYTPVVRPPLGHLGSTEDAAAAIVFLAGDLAGFVTGTTVNVDGGTWAAGGWRRADGS